MMKIEMDLENFTVPDFVVAAMPLDESRLIRNLKFELNELSEDELSMLCTRFRQDVFAKAGKVDPQGR